MSDVTIVVAPRERFSLSDRSLDSVLRETPGPVRMIYVDGGSPEPIRRAIEQRRDQHGFTLIRTDHILSPNEARNLAIPHVETRWVVFLDNDVIVSPGWLDRLLDDAERHDADIAGPLYLIGEPEDQVIHMAGGEAHFVDADGTRRFKEAHLFMNKPLAEVRDQIQTRDTELVEFHCMLVRRDVFDRFGPLDDGLMSALEHADLCMQVREAGGRIRFCAESCVSYVIPPPFEPFDFEFFVLRWSEGWNAHTLDRFMSKWRIDPDDPYYGHAMKWLSHQREIALPFLPFGRLAGRMKYKGPKALGRALVHRIEERIISKARDARARAGVANNP